MLRGLRRLGEIDLFVLADPDQGEGSPAAHDLPVERVTVLKCPRVLRDRPRAGLWIVWAGLFLGTYFTRLWKLFGAGPGAWKGFGFAVGSSLGPVTLGAAILACIWAVGPRLAGRLASGGRNRKRSCSSWRSSASRRQHRRVPLPGVRKHTGKPTLINGG
ncbi:MAG: hypothetical protein ACRDGN_07145 [bacterium]